MKLTPSQQKRFWREWSNACHVQGWTRAQSWTGAQIDAERHALLARAGFSSLTQVDHTAGFDRVLAELALLARPANMNSQLRQIEQPRTRLLWSIRHSGQKYNLSTEYWQTIAIDRFGTSDLEQLTTPQLEQLRNTLASRAAAYHTAAKRAREAAEDKPEPRIQFPDQPKFADSLTSEETFPDQVEFQPEPGYEPETVDCPF